MLPLLVFLLLMYSASSSLRRWMIRLPGVSPIMSCRRVKDTVSPSGSAARVATIRSRVGTWISGSSASGASVGMGVPSGTLPPGGGTGLNQERGGQGDTGDQPCPGRPEEGGDAGDDSDGERATEYRPVGPCLCEGRAHQAEHDQRSGGRVDAVDDRVAGPRVLKRSHEHIDQDPGHRQDDALGRPHAGWPLDAGG